MTGNRIYKQAVRARMAATGESYSTAARATALEPITFGDGLSNAFGEGLRNGELHLVASRPGGGTSSLMAAVAVALATSGKTVLCLNPELGAIEFRDSMTRAAARGGEALALKAKSESATRRLRLSSAASLRELREELDRGQAPAVLLVDRFELLKECFNPDASAWDAFNGAGPVLRALAQEFRVPVVVGAQAARGVSEDLASAELLRARGLYELAATVTASKRNDAGFETRLLKNRFGSTDATIAF